MIVELTGGLKNSSSKPKLAVKVQSKIRRRIYVSSPIKALAASAFFPFDAKLNFNL